MSSTRTRLDQPHVGHACEAVLYVQGSCAASRRVPALCREQLPYRPVAALPVAQAQDALAEVGMGRAGAGLGAEVGRPQDVPGSPWLGPHRRGTRGSASRPTLTGHSVVISGNDGALSEREPLRGWSATTRLTRLSCAQATKRHSRNRRRRSLGRRVAHGSVDLLWSCHAL
jgi:hypothetical protein